MSDKPIIFPPTFREWTPAEQRQRAAAQAARTDGGQNSGGEPLVTRLRKRAEIRRQSATRKSVQEGKPDRIADLLEEAAVRLTEAVVVCRDVERIFRGNGVSNVCPICHWPKEGHAPDCRLASFLEE